MCVDVHVVCVDVYVVCGCACSVDVHVVWVHVVCGCACSVCACACSVCGCACSVLCGCACSVYVWVHVVCMCVCVCVDVHVVCACMWVCCEYTGVLSWDAHSPQVADFFFRNWRPWKCRHANVAVRGTCTVFGVQTATAGGGVSGYWWEEKQRIAKANRCKLECWCGHGSRVRMGVVPTVHE